MQNQEIDHAKAVSREKRLIHIPIIHTPDDMGELKPSIQKQILRKQGRTVLKRRTDLIHELWSQIETIIDNYELDYEKVRVYQDGLPVCGLETRIVADLADQGIRNHQLLMRLMRKGAVLMGTESSDLLLQEYGMVKEVVFRGNISTARETGPRTKKSSDRLLEKRDQFIAARIDQTLQTGETGIIFLGMLHDLEPWLSKPIRVVRPLNTYLHNRLGNR